MSNMRDLLSMQWRCDRLPPRPLYTQSVVLMDETKTSFFVPDASSFGAESQTNARPIESPSRVEVSNQLAAVGTQHPHYFSCSCCSRRKRSRLSCR